MKKFLFAIAVGAAIGTIVAILIAFSLMDGTIPFKSADVFSFVIATLAIIVGVFTVIGAVAVVTTYNDIRTKSMEIVTEQIDEVTKKREAYLVEGRTAFFQMIDNQDKTIKNQMMYIWTVSLLASCLFAIFVQIVFRWNDNTKTH